MRVTGWSVVMATRTPAWWRTAAVLKAMFWTSILLRLERSGQYAAEHGFDYFCSTLSISPMKNAAKLNEIGAELSELYPVKLLPSDFKKKGGYLRSIELSREYGLYRQNYCGCVFSKQEAQRRENEKTN